VSPADIIERYGADTARCYILFIGPPEKDADWSDSGVGGVNRFLSRLWTAAHEAPEGDVDPEGDASPLVRKAHWAIDRVTRDMQVGFGFNTAIAAVMELINEVYRQRDSVPASHVRFAIATASSLIFPFAPHCAAEAYEMMTGERVWEEPWPEADPALLVSDEIQLVVQLNGKLVDRVAAPAQASREQLEEIARGSGKLAARLNGREIVKAVVVPGKLVNFVVR
jgi:leucyl-tRNA synthetase